jgi:hypothetical protein
VGEQHLLIDNAFQVTAVVEVGVDDRVPAVREPGPQLTDHRRHVHEVPVAPRTQVIGIADGRLPVPIDARIAKAGAKTPVEPQRLVA